MKRYKIFIDGVQKELKAERRKAKKSHKDILIYIKGENTEDKSREPGVQKLGRCWIGCDIIKGAIQMTNLHPFPLPC